VNVVNYLLTCVGVLCMISGNSHFFRSCRPWRV